MQCHRLHRVAGAGETYITFDSLPGFADGTNARVAVGGFWNCRVPYREVESNSHPTLRLLSTAPEKKFTLETILARLATGCEGRIIVLDHEIRVVASARRAGP
jgi:hypothetical protein